jgi:hypothetical protein
VRTTCARIQIYARGHRVNTATEVLLTRVASLTFRMFSLFRCRATIWAGVIGGIGKGEWVFVGFAVDGISGTVVAVVRCDAGCWWEWVVLVVVGLSKFAGGFAASDFVMTPPTRSTSDFSELSSTIFAFLRMDHTLQM